MARECKVSLRSSNDDFFDVSEVMAFESQPIKNMIDDTSFVGATLLPIFLERYS